MKEYKRYTKLFKIIIKQFSAACLVYNRRPGFWIDICSPLRTFYEKLGQNLERIKINGIKLLQKIKLYGLRVGCTGFGLRAGPTGYGLV